MEDRLVLIREDPEGHPQILRAIKKNLVNKCLEMLAEIAELKDDYTESYEQLGKCLNLGNHEDSAIRTKIAELLRFNASVSEDEQLNLKEYVDRTKGELKDIYFIIGESIAAVSSFLVLGILREKGLEEKVRYTDKSIDVPVVRQGQVPTIQTAQRTVEVPKIVSQDRIQQRTAEQITDAPVPQVTEELFEVFDERVVEIPVPQVTKAFNVCSQSRVQQRIVEPITETPAVSFAEEIVEAPKA